MVKSIIWHIPVPCLVTLGLRGHMGVALVDSRALTPDPNGLGILNLSLIPQANQSLDSSSALPPNSIVLFTLYIFLTCADVYDFSVVFGVCGPTSHSVLSLSVALFGFTQTKPRQQCWLRGLCIPLGWWRGLSSEHSLRPGADRSFTSTSLSNTPLDMRQHPAKRSAGGTRTHRQTLNTSYTTHTLSLSREKKRRLGHFATNFSHPILYPFLTLANRVQCMRRGDKKGPEKKKSLD